MAHQTIKVILNQTDASAESTPTHVYDPALKAVYTTDSHKRLLHAREHEPNVYPSSWHHHLFDLLEAKDRKREAREPSEKAKPKQKADAAQKPSAPAKTNERSGTSWKGVVRDLADTAAKTKS